MAHGEGKCLEFPIDFDTKRTQHIPIGRIMFGNSCARITIAPDGLHLWVPKGPNVHLMEDLTEQQIVFKNNNDPNR